MTCVRDTPEYTNKSFAVQQGDLGTTLLAKAKYPIAKGNVWRQHEI
ncbi:MAG: hypothetical protein HY356_04595 [Gammaproteobacteria bacterium]|nr:hypothetical protein [Gammaproteobacteria bacterium]